MPVCACGLDSDPDARFCRDCGLSLGNDAAAHLLAPDDGDNGGDETVVQRARPGRHFWLPVAAALVALAVGWGLWRATVGSPDPIDGEDDTAEVTVPDVAVPDGDDVADANVTSTPVSVAEPGESVVGGDVDYDLVVGTEQGRPVIVDLDDGSIHHVDGNRVTPVAVSGRWLVVDSGLSAMWILPLDDLGAEPTELLPVVDAQFVATVGPDMAVIDPGRLWVETAGAEDGAPVRRRIDLDTNTVLEHPFAGPRSLQSYLAGGRLADGDAGLLNGPAGGVYEWVDGGYRLVADGQLIVADGERALVETCEELSRCSRAWLDRTTWEPLDLIAPTGRDVAWFMILGTDWLYAYDNATDFTATGSGGGLLNIRTGANVDVKHPDTDLYWSGLPAVSPDGEWLAEVGEEANTVELRNMATGRTVAVPIDARVSGHMFFFDE